MSKSFWKEIEGIQTMPPGTLNEAVELDHSDPRGRYRFVDCGAQRVSLTIGDGVNDVTLLLTFAQVAEFLTTMTDAVIAAETSFDKALSEIGAEPQPGGDPG